MWLPSKNAEPKKDGGNGLVAVAIDKDKGSQNALKWAIDHLLQRGQTVLLIHVKLRHQSFSSSPTLPSSWTNNNDLSYRGTDPDSITKELFLPFRCFCTRKDIQCRDIMLEDVDVAKALIEYVSQTAIENLVIGSPAKSTFLRRFKALDIPSTALKGAPDFCNVYVVSKGKIQSMRSASRPAPAVSPLLAQLPKQSTSVSDLLELHSPQAPIRKAAPPPEAPRKSHEAPQKSHEEAEFVRSPFTRDRYMGRSYGDASQSDSNESYATSGRESIDRLFSSFYNNESGKQSPLPISRSRTEGELDMNRSFESLQLGRRSVETSTSPQFSSVSQDSERLSTGTQAKEDVESEMRRLKLELKQTMEMYSTACKEALSATQKAKELQRWKVEEERKFEEARLAEEAALAIVEQEKAKSRAAIEAAQAAKRIAELEAEKRIHAERKALKEAEEKKKAFDALAQTDVRYRRYSIDEIEAATEYFSESRKIGEGGYGPVYKCFLDHTSVAVKVLRPDASQGRSQFQQEVEVLSCIRHPNMVLLLGACPEYGCLVYEFMANGSLEDRLFQRGNTRSLPWQIRFKIAAEIGTGLLFLHQTKPEPLVHRDLKPANILLDRNYVSKISDVGLARLVPSSVVDNVTQYRMTSTAGTFCYIDPEYQQTGMLGVKSDIYSLGIMFLQMITAKPPMGLTHIVERAIEKGTFVDILDRTVPDWPVEEALSFAKMALSCAELRRKDRPDLGKSILPELNRLRLLAEEAMQPMPMGRDANPSPNHSQVSLQLETTADHQPPLSCESSRNPSCTL